MEIRVHCKIACITCSNSVSKIHKNYGTFRKIGFVKMAQEAKQVQ